MANTFFYPPPSNDLSEALYIPSGTAIEILWTCNYKNLNLRVYQKKPDGSYTYSTLLSEVSIPPGNSSVAWSAKLVEGTTAPMHFEITLASNGQSLDPFNSAVFYVDNSSAIFTSRASSSTTSLTSTFSTSTSMTSFTSTIATTTGSPISSPTSNSQPTPMVGLGIGLGLGIPFILLIIALLGCTLSRRRKKMQVAPVAELADPPKYYKYELQADEPTYELEGHPEVHEAPS